MVFMLCIASLIGDCKEMVVDVELDKELCLVGGGGGLRIICDISSAKSSDSDRYGQVGMVFVSSSIPFLDNLVLYLRGADVILARPRCLANMSLDPSVVVDRFDQVARVGKNQTLALLGAL